MESASAPIAAQKITADSAGNTANESNVSGSGAEAPPGQAIAAIPQSQPQLIKRAELSLVVKSIEASLKAVSAIAQRQQGDLVGLQDQKPQDTSIRHTASMQIQVPQERLEATLDAIAALGNVQSRAITVEDVSSQLVDYQSRLRNLRRSEEMLLKIMERSGSMNDVLRVTQELSNVRQSIEQTDGQLKSLQGQVAFSTISLSLAEPIAASPPPQSPVGLQVQETWGQATHSMGKLTVGLLNLSIWLFVYSPYLLLVGGLGAIAYHRFQKPAPASPSVTTPPPASDPL
jgi:two-component sensor histidine kinase